MANITRATVVGNGFRLYADDRRSWQAVPDGHARFLLPSIPVGEGGTTPPPDPDPGQGGSTPSGPIGAAPASLVASSTSGVVWRLGSVQLNHGRGILLACAELPQANNKRVMQIALITALVESGGLWMYSNVRHYPETANYPHERDAADSDSVGLFQQRPSAGWGTPKQCMEERYSTRAFLGVESNPNRGLFDIPWQTYATPGRAAQKVQVSAFPDRYDTMVPVADAIIKAMVK